MVSEEEYTHELIERVRQRPVIYEVDLTDYKNKNKKGEAFKELQDELRGIGCSEAQGWVHLLKNLKKLKLIF